MAIENTVSSDFDPRSSIVKSVIDCRLPGVNMFTELLRAVNYFSCNFYQPIKFDIYCPQKEGDIGT